MSGSGSGCCLCSGSRQLRRREQAELFTAWRRFLERIAEERPTVLVFEDLHWADEAMLAFLEHLADLAEGVPLLLVGTARPELYEQFPRLRHEAPQRQPDQSRAIVAGGDRPPRVGLARCDRAACRVAAADPRPRGRQSALRGGVRQAVEGPRAARREPVRAGDCRDGAEVPFPESVQSLIAARLDTLDPDAKSLLADAAVIGKVFWAGAVAAMGDRDPQAVIGTLRELSRKELVRPARQSTMEGEAEYSFWHILARDVAYHQLPRGSRGYRHVAAAAWIESKVPGRVEVLADVLAFHYATALELAQAAGQTDQATAPRGTGPPVPQPRRRAGARIGHGGRPHRTSSARSRWRRRVIRERAEALARFAVATFHAGRPTDSAAALDEAITSFRAQEDAARRNPCHCCRSVSVLYRLGDPLWAALPAETVALLEPLPPGPELVMTLTELARVEMLTGQEPDVGVRHAAHALALAEELGLPRPARTLGYLGPRPLRVSATPPASGHPGGDRAGHRRRARTRSRP